MARSKSRVSWLQEHFNDPYVIKARECGYRSRAAFKLLGMDSQDRLFRPGMFVVDLGAAPGGWSQVARAKTGKSGRVLATDILAMEPLPGVTFVRGDFTTDQTLEELCTHTQDSLVDLVLSDMAPAMSGIKLADQAGSLYLAELARDFCGQMLKPGGSFVVKVFSGAGFDGYLSDLRKMFVTVRVRKPAASRPGSGEVYLCARKYRRPGV